MHYTWLLLGIVGLSLFSTRCLAQDDDDEDDGIVEDVPDEKVVVEKKRYETPKLTGKPHLMESFDNPQDYKKRWTLSQAKKDDIDEEIAKYDGIWSLEEPKDAALEGDLGLVLKTKAKHHAVSTKLSKPYEFAGKPFIVSYEVRFQNGMDCGGAYIKLLSKTDKLDLKSFRDKTPYTIMFGPDKCGLDHKLHFIFRHKNPKTGEYEEKHAKKPAGKLDSYFTDKKTHLYTLVVNPDNSFEVLVDNKVINSGSLLEDFSPPVNPPKEIDDPNDKKPEDWDEREKIPDPEASKPDDWDEDAPNEIPDESAVKPDGWLDDEEALIPDPDSEKPADWDEEMDGEWEAALIDNPLCKDAPGCGLWTRPMIPNPEYKGKWKPPMIDNPNYQGEWSPRRISNPAWFEDDKPYKMTPIDALGLELWSMTDDIVFDNFIITEDRELHASWLEQTFEKKTNAEYYSGGSNALVQGILDVTRDRPWLWAVFLVVIVLPIVLIIAYCCMPKNQGIWNTLLGAAEQRPWLYAVYIVVLLLPVVLLSICLCPRSGPIKPEDIEERKKTDAMSPDDEPVEEEEEASKEAMGPGGDSPVKPKKSKAALETEEEANVDSNKEEEDEEEEQTQEKPSSPKRSPRKRKPRKE